jgi:hypothetical protein
VPWGARFDDPIALANGRKLLTLQGAATHITNLPKKESDLPEWQAAIEALMLVADRCGHDVCSDRRDEGSKPTRRARVRPLTQGKALGPPQTRARSIKQEAVGVVALAPS